MARQEPNTSILLSLLPDNDAARQVVHYSPNSHLVSHLVTNHEEDGPPSVLNVAEPGTKSHLTLATIGRNADIMVPPSAGGKDARVSSIQCSFHVHETTGVIMVQDCSFYQNTQFHKEKAIPFEQARVPRRVVIDPTINIFLGFGGIHANTFLFRIVWHKVPERYLPAFRTLDNPRMKRTQELFPDDTQFERHVSDIGSDQKHLRMWYTQETKIGEGQFGEVYKVINVHSGGELALKRVFNVNPLAKSTLQREIKIMKGLSHENIVRFVATQSMEQVEEIFMQLKEINLDEMIDRGDFLNNRSAAEPLLQQMLQAISYLTCKNVIHRDVKPANILVSTVPDGFDPPHHHFQLSDFGLANYVSLARTFAGSAIWMAPEIRADKGVLATSKADIWSLYVVILQALDVCNFHKKTKGFQHEEELDHALKLASEDAVMFHLRPMAHPDPLLRASANDMLDKLFRGEGRTLPSVPDNCSAMAVEHMEPLKLDANTVIKSRMRRGQSQGGVVKVNPEKVGEKRRRRAAGRLV